MPLVETVSNVANPLLSRRELVCNFPGLGGKLGKIEAIEMVTKEFNLTDKFVLASSLKNQVGRTNIIGAFFIYDDESLARSHLKPAIFARLEKARKKQQADADKDDANPEAAASEEG